MSDLCLRVGLLASKESEDRASRLAARLNGYGIEAQCLASRRSGVGLFESRATVRPFSLIHALDRGGADFAARLADRLRIPYVVTVDDFYAPGRSLRLRRRWCRAVIVDGAELADDLIRSMGLPARAIMIVGEGIEPPPAPSPRPSRATAPVIGACVGSEIGSGLSTFLRAAKIVQDEGADAEFVIACDGEAGRLARRLAGPLGVADRLTMSGGERAGLPFWDVLDLYCHPSRVPNTGRTLALAMARAIPSIAARVPGLLGLIGDREAPEVVPAGDAEALARSILATLADLDTAQSRAEVARFEVLRDRSPEREAETLASLYRRSLDAPPVIGVRGRFPATSEKKF